MLVRRNVTEIGGFGSAQACRSKGHMLCRERIRHTFHQQSEELRCAIVMRVVYQQNRVLKRPGHGWPCLSWTQI